MHSICQTEISRQARKSNLITWEHSKLTTVANYSHCTRSMKDAPSEHIAKSAAYQL